MASTTTLASAGAPHQEPTTPTVTSPTSPTTLPQYGFGQDITFGKLVDGNPFLFRVHTPRSQPPSYDGTEPYFVGTKYGDAISSATFHSPCPSAASSSNPSEWTYGDAVQHLDWTTRSSSPYISTSFSFAWAIWEAIRRYHLNVKHDVEIAVIDANAVTDRAVTAVELLMKASPKERHKDHWKWYRFAVEAQDVLVWGHIPGSAVLASIPLLQILSKLPSYFLYPELSDTSKDTPLNRLSWDYTQKRPSFRQFCQSMSDRFLRMPLDKRMRDTTAGSVRLALCLLRPFIHKHISDNFSDATTKVCDLSIVIAYWPGQWWAREHPEIRDLVRCIVHIVGEEMREARRVQAVADANKMQEIVGGLEQLAKAYEARTRVNSVASRKKGKFIPPPLLDSGSESGDTVLDSPTEDKSDAWSTTSDSTLASAETKEVQTDPISEEDNTPRPPSTPVIPPADNETAERDLPSLPDADDEKIEVEETTIEQTVTITVTHDTCEPQPKSEETNLDLDSSFISSALSSITDSARGVTLDGVARTASCFFTGLFIGSFITLCIISNRKRELLLLT